MGIPLLRGRDIVESDAEVLLVSAAAAKLYWGTDDPIGRRATLPALSKTILRQVVGIVGDVKQRSLTEGSTPTAYYYTREPSGRATFVVRTSVPSATLAQPVVAAIHDQDISVEEDRRLEALIEQMPEQVGLRGDRHLLSRVAEAQASDVRNPKLLEENSLK